MKFPTGTLGNVLEWTLIAALLCVGLVLTGVTPLGLILWGVGCFLLYKKRAYVLCTLFSFLLVISIADYAAVFCMSCPDAGRKSQCANNMRNIVLALINYESAHQRFPAAVRLDKEGRPLQSWRVETLPFLELQNLYSRANLKKPWDDPVNANVRNTSIPLFHCPSCRQEGKCNYLAITGPDTVWPNEGKVRLKDISDDPGETLLLVEVADGLADWSEPKDLSLEELCDSKNEEKTLKLFSVHSGGAHVVFCDGFIQWMRAETLVKNLRALATRNGGEKIELDERKQKE